MLKAVIKNYTKNQNNITLFVELSDIENGINPFIKEYSYSTGSALTEAGLAQQFIQEDQIFTQIRNRYIIIKGWEGDSLWIRLSITKTGNIDIKVSNVKAVPPQVFVRYEIINELTNQSFFIQKIYTQLSEMTIASLTTFLLDTTEKLNSLTDSIPVITNLIQNETDLVTL